MSCFICSEKHFVSIANALKTRLYGNTETRLTISYALGINHHKLSFDQLDSIVESFITELNAENFKAYSLRYNGDEDIEIDPVNFQSFDFVPLNNLNLIKQLRCLHYQCDGDQDKSQAFNKLEKLINNLQSEFIGNLPEYGALPWEIN
jgi:hypothetical protein